MINVKRLWACPAASCPSPRGNVAACQAVPQRWCNRSLRPRRIGLPDGGGRTGIGVETQQHQPWRAPSSRLFQTGRRPPESAQPGHRRTGNSAAIIARTGNNRNRHSTRDIAPPPPVVKLRQIVGAHDPRETFGGPTATNPRQSINGIARAQFALDGRNADRRAPRLRPGRGHAGGKRGHARTRLQWIARRHQPPHLIQPQRGERHEADAAMAPMGGVEAPAHEADTLRIGFQGRTCPVPRTCHL